MASSLPTPGQLIVDNLTLLAGSPTAFHDRYAHHITPTTFLKPGNHAPANCVLHFLLCLIDPDLTEPLFKPCFPILDRDQERDFRRVVDSRLAVLEKTKLLPTGSARKSVVASGGGDRFLDLLWSLSSLAVQQACLRHPAYSPVSRLRMISHQSRPDTLTHQSSARSNRSLFSVVSVRSDRPTETSQPPSNPTSTTSSSTRQRRFLGVGLLSAAEQRSRDATTARARIDAERTTLERTVNVGKEGANTWASEADSLREKIGQFEAKLARLKGQLADMGFDENGIDIRDTDNAAHLSTRPPTPPNKPTLSTDSSSTVSDPSVNPSTVSSTVASLPVELNHPTPITSTPLAPGDLRTSPSGDDLVDHLKTSPFDSTESGSSVDELQDSDITADLSRLLTFTADTAATRREVDDALQHMKPPPQSTAAVLVPPAQSGQTSNVDQDTMSAANDIVILVRAATSELEQATNRMDEIRRERARMNGEEQTRNTNVREPSSGPSADKIMSPVKAHVAVLENENSCPKPNTEEIAEKEVKDSSATSIDSTKDESVPLEQLASDAVDKHRKVVDTSTKIRDEALELTEKSQDIIRKTKPKSSSQKTNSAEPDNKKWLTKSNVAMPADEVLSATAKGSPSPAVDDVRDVSFAATALRNSAPPERKVRNDAGRRHNMGNRSLDSINFNPINNNRTVDISPRYDTDCAVSPVVVTPVQAKAPRVRFAKLPPSYRRSREEEQGSPAGRPTRLATEVHPKSPKSSARTKPELLPEDEDKAPASTKSTTEGNRRDVASTSEKRSSKSKEGSSSRKHDPARAAEASAAEVQHTMGANAQKPPRLQRRQTHRIVSQKHVISRQVTPSSSRKSTRPGSDNVRGSHSPSPRHRAVPHEREVLPSPTPSPIPSTQSSPVRAPGTEPSPPSLELTESVATAESAPSPSVSSVTIPSAPSDESLPIISATVKPILPSRDETPSVETSPQPATPIVSEASLTPSPIAVSEHSLSPIDSVAPSSAPMSVIATTEDEPMPEESSSEVLAVNAGVTEGSSSSSGNINDIVGKSDSSGSMIGSSEDWPDSQISEDSGQKGQSPESGTGRSGRGSGKKNRLLPKNSSGMFGSFHVGKNRNSSLLRDGSPKNKEMSPVLGTSESAESVVSAGRPPLPQRNGNMRSSSGGGFFAGQTAQWQENVRCHSNAEGHVAEGGVRYSDEASVRGGRGSARSASANPPSRKNRVQSFRARLAALK